MGGRSKAGRGGERRRKENDECLRRKSSYPGSDLEAIVEWLERRSVHYALSTCKGGQPICGAGFQAAPEVGVRTARGGIRLRATDAGGWKSLCEFRRRF